MRREINLSGGEITLLKTMGLSGTSIFGRFLVERAGDMEQAEFLDELNGLISLGGNLFLMWLLVSRLHMNYLVANASAIVVCSIVNFLVSDRLVFRADS